MRNLILFFCLLSVTLVFDSCKKAPVACFTMDKTSALVYDTIICDAGCSLKAKKYTWLITNTIFTGDVNSPKGAFTFSKPGRYLLKLEVTNGSKEDVIAHSITIY